MGLENYETHLSQLLSQQHLNYYSQKLAQDVLNGNSYQKVFLAFYSAYCKNDLNTINQLIATYPYLSATGISENEDLELPKNLVSLLRANRCFYVVDVSQLAGKNNLLKLLKQEGFELKPI